jgi:hypothetical protein
LALAEGICARRGNVENVSGDDPLSGYNYDAFVPEKFERWLNFDASPPLGRPAPDFPLWDLECNEITLSEVWSGHVYTIVEFGSFT